MLENGTDFNCNISFENPCDGARGMGVATSLTVVDFGKVEDVDVDGDTEDDRDDSDDVDE